MPVISVVMPAYNSSNTIEASVKSVLGQSFTDFELIIVNDCSKDNTLDVIESLAESDSRIKVIANAQNRGVAFSRNAAVSAASGEWIAFLDSDDIWREDKLEKQLALTKENSEAVLIGTASGFMDWEGNPYSYIMPIPEKIDYKTLLGRNILSCSSVMVKTELIKNVKMYSDKISEDYAAWLTILRDIKYAYGINEPLLTYRVQKNSKSSSRLKSVKMLYKTYKYVGYNAIVSAFLVLRYTLYSVSKRSKIKNS